MVGKLRTKELRKQYPNILDQPRITERLARRKGYQNKNDMLEELNDDLMEAREKARIFRAKTRRDQVNKAVKDFKLQAPKRSGNQTGVYGEVNNLSDIKKIARKAGITRRDPNKRYAVIINSETFRNGEDDEGERQTAYFNTPEEAIQEAEELNERWEAEYEGSADGKTYKMASLSVGGGMGGRGGRSYKIATNTWSIFSKTSKINCLYNAVVFGIYPQNYNDFINNKMRNNKLIMTLMSKELKYRVNPNKKTFSNEETIQEVANYKKCKIIVYNNIFEKLREFYPHNKKYKHEVEIQLKNGHYIGLLRWRELAKHGVEKPPEEEQVDENEESVEKQIEKQDKEKEAREIVKFSDVKQYNDKLMSYDIECSPDPNRKGEHMCYAVGLGWYENGVEQYIEFRGMDAPEKTFKFLHDNRVKFDGYFLYGHNGGGYDLPNFMKSNLLDSKIWNIITDNVVELNGSFISLGIYSDDERTLYFRDSAKMLAGTLKDLCNEMDVKYKKLPELVDHNDIAKFNEINNFDIDKLYKMYPDIELYLKHDVLGLLEVIYNFSKVIEDITHKEFKKYNKKKDEKELISGGLNMQDMLTGATLSKKLFYHKYYDGYNKPIYSLPDWMDNFIRDGYYGGRNEIFHLGLVDKKLYYHDFTSLYPDVGRKLLPYGKPEYIENLKNINNFFGFVKTLVRTINYNAKPFHGVKENGKLVFRHISKWTEVSLFSEEMRFGLVNKLYEYKPISGIKFQKARIMEKFFNDGFKFKCEAKAQGKPSTAKAWKIIINSGYGFWGLRAKDREGIVMFKSEDACVGEYLDKGQLLQESDIGNYTILRVKKDLEVHDFNVGIASAISSYARTKLWTLMNDVEKKGGTIYMCDTDSIVSDYDLFNDKEIQEKFMWDKTGDELGSLKNEANDEIKDHGINKDKMTKEELKEAKQYNKDLLARHNEKENGSIYFDGGVFGGCKFYSLIKRLDDDSILEINKCKGYKKDDNLKFDKFLQLAKNQIEYLEQDQTQFQCPRSNYVNETTPFVMRTPQITKQFKMQYTKGVVTPSGKIIPFTDKQIIKKSKR